MARVSAQTGTLVFAIINLVTVTCLTIGGIVLLTYFCVNAFFTYAPSANFETNMLPANMEPAIQIAIATFLLILSSVDLLFSSFLMNGILKKKSEHIKIYYIFGATKAILSLLLVFMAFKIDSCWLSYSYMYCMVLVLHFLYALVLRMIRNTYLQLEVISKQFKHVPLPEKC